MVKHADIDHTGITGAGGAVATDALWDAAGDLAVGSGANTAAKLTMGTALQHLRVNSGATGLEWADPSASSSLTNLAIGTFDALRAGTASATNAIVNDRVYFTKIIPRDDITVDTAIWQCGTSAGNLDIGIYDAALTTKLGSTGSFASPGTGQRSQALTGSVALTAGTVYYGAFVCSNATIRVPTITTVVMGFGSWNLYGVDLSGSVLPLPSAITPTWDVNTAYPVFWFTA